MGINQDTHGSINGDEASPGSACRTSLFIAGDKAADELIWDYYGGRLG